MKAVTAILAAAASVASASSLFAPIFTDRMVVQAPAARFFGHTAESFAHVSLSIDGKVVARGRSDARGFWSITADVAADAMDTTVGHTVAVSTSGNEKTELTDVLFGNVVICGGQNEMASRGRVGNTAYAAIRGISVENERATWKKIDAGSDFSSVCYGVGEQAAADMQTPIGLVDASISGSALADWVRSAQILEPECLAVAGAKRGRVFNKLDDMGVTGIAAAGVTWLHDGAVAEEEKCIATAMSEGFKKKFLSADPRSLGDEATVRVIAHRGLASACPENTMPATEAARRGGTEWIEDDTSPSKDGVPMVCHDTTVDRTTDGTGKIKSKTLEELKKLDAGSWFAPSFTGTRMPTLQEQCEDVKSRGGNLLIEIKDAHTLDEMKAIHTVIQDTGMAKNVIIQSFNLQNLIYSYQIDPSIQVHFLSNNFTNPAQLVQLYNLSGFNPGMDVTSHWDKVKDVQALGAVVYVWTPDTASEWQTLLDNGVDGIITNKATTLQGYLQGIAAKSTLQSKPSRAVVFAESGADGKLTSTGDVATSLWKSLRNEL